MQIPAISNCCVYPVFASQNMVLNLGTKNSNMSGLVFSKFDLESIFTCFGTFQHGFSSNYKTCKNRFLQTLVYNTLAKKTQRVFACKRGDCEKTLYAEKCFEMLLQLWKETSGTI